MRPFATWLYVAYAQHLPILGTPKIVLMEATGGFERRPLVLLGAAGLPVAAINPRNARDFAKSIGLTNITMQYSINADPTHLIRRSKDVLARADHQHQGAGLRGA
jgi:transposase